LNLTFHLTFSQSFNISFTLIYQSIAAEGFGEQLPNGDVTSEDKEAKNDYF
jgi:hypothetical protein